MKKVVSVLLTVALLSCFLSIPMSAGAANSGSAKSFNIDNPYKNVDWDSWQAYKTQLHCHTQASDGYLSIADAIEEYYNLDYDAVAITDHGTNNQGWNKVPNTIPIMRAIKSERTGGANNPIIPVSDELYNAYLNGSAKTSDGSVRTHSGGMVDIEKGNELNMATPFADCHLTHYWCDYGEGYAGVFGDYETPSRESSKDGGVVMLSHVGEYVYIDKDSYDHVAQPVDEYYVNKFAKIFLDNAVNSGEPGFVAGMGINSATDAHTRCDRILYDQILQKTIPNGVVPWGFSFSDSHNLTSMNDAYTMMLIPDWSALGNAERNAKLRECMVNGEFFSVSHYSNGVEFDGEREFNEIPPDIDWPSDEILTMNSTPMVTFLSVDDASDTITVKTSNANRIVWVSNGNVIKRETVENGENGECTFVISLGENGLKNDVSMFLRFYITGPQGICYSQPFVLHELDSAGNEIPFEKVDVPKSYDLPFFLRLLVTVLDWTVFKFNPVIWIFKYFALGYDPINQAVTSVLDLFR